MQQSNDSIDERRKMEKSPFIRFWPRLAPFAGTQYLSLAQAQTLELLLVEFLVDGCDRQFLKFASRFLTPTSYEDVVTERNVVHLCGYPICSKGPQQNTSHRIRYRKPSMILPATYLSSFCSRECYQASTFYKSQLSTEGIITRKDITCAPFGSLFWEREISLLDEIVEKFGSANVTADNLIDLIDRFHSLQVHDQKINNRGIPSKTTSNSDLEKYKKDISNFQIIEHSQENTDEDMKFEVSDEEGHDMIEGHRPQLFK